MRRREFIAGLGGAAAWPVVVRAQQPAMPARWHFSAFGIRRLRRFVGSISSWAG